MKPDRFNDENAPNKRDFRRRMVSRIWSEINQREIGKGVPVVSLTNTNLRIAWREFGDFLGSEGSLYVAEINPKILDTIRNNRFYLPPVQRPRTVIPVGATDFYDVARLVQMRMAPKLWVLDGDFCTTWATEKEKFLPEIKAIISAKKDQHLFFTLTRSFRGPGSRYDTRNIIIQEVRRIAPGIECLMSHRYNDNQVVESFLFRYKGK